MILSAHWPWWNQTGNGISLSQSSYVLLLPVFQTLSCQVPFKPAFSHMNHYLFPSYHCLFANVIPLQLATANYWSDLSSYHHLYHMDDGCIFSFSGTVNSDMSLSSKMFSGVGLLWSGAFWAPWLFQETLHPKTDLAASNLPSQFLHWTVLPLHHTQLS